MEFPLKRIDDFIWELPISYKKGMLVPGVFLGNQRVLSKILSDGSINQLANASMLPGVRGRTMAMPDVHVGYGLPIGGVLPMDAKEGLVCPGATGYDINCGVRLLRTDLCKSDLKGMLKPLMSELFKNIPSGVGCTGKVRLSKNECKDVLETGAAWAVKKGFGNAEHLSCIESGGMLKASNPGTVSAGAFSRGADQLGTLGSGNHFLEVQIVDQVFDPETASDFGLKLGGVVVMIHTGSRGLGHQVCGDFLSVMGKAVKKYRLPVPDLQLAGAPIQSQEGQAYLSAMSCAANYAWANRQVLSHLVEETFVHSLKLPRERVAMSLVYDMSHNIIKFEEHIVDGKKRKLAIHRKGATRAFPKKSKEVPEKYRGSGQPVIIPGDMGTASYVLSGSRRALENSFGSSCHGAGRAMSRSVAKKLAKGRAIDRELADMGIICCAKGRQTLREEMPDAYKNIDDVIH
ncbi:MAG: RtcB family protein, partial [Nitrospinota bacterium]